MGRLTTDYLCPTEFEENKNYNIKCNVSCCSYIGVLMSSNTLKAIFNLY